jgi:hypothetical protein
MTRTLRSPLGGLVANDQKTRAELRAARAQGWHAMGLVALYPEEIQDPETRAVFEREAARQFGKRATT